MTVCIRAVSIIRAVTHERGMPISAAALLCPVECANCAVHSLASQFVKVRCPYSLTLLWAQDAQAPPTPTAALLPSVLASPSPCFLYGVVILRVAFDRDGSSNSFSFGLFTVKSEK
ncbi:hypothetical protein DFJ73DRAFT_957608 [Zopfochytrium polystomum]|nr:hypothetical protein DFJ73DRAFT_957608 [Zopfochytrium polystomum]